VGLTAEVEMSLTDASLVAFYDKNQKAFKATATRAYAFAYGNVLATGLPLRPDDVATGLVTALLVNEDLRNCLAEKKLRPRYWYTHFANLILDRLWKELKDEHTAATAAKPN
jgi:hypothetical protein